MTRPPPRSTRSYTLFPYTTLCRSPRRALRPDTHRQRQAERSRVATGELRRQRRHAGLHARHQTRSWLGQRHHAALVPLIIFCLPLFPSRQIIPSGSTSPYLRRSDERRVGKEVLSTCRFRLSPFH